MGSLNKATFDLVLRGVAIACIALLSNSALADATPQTVSLNGNAGGKRFDGIGVQSA